MTPVDIATRSSLAGDDLKLFYKGDEIEGVIQFEVFAKNIGSEHLQSINSENLGDMRNPRLRIRLPPKSKLLRSSVFTFGDDRATTFGDPTLNERGHLEYPIVLFNRNAVVQILLTMANARREVPPSFEAIGLGLTSKTSGAREFVGTNIKFWPGLVRYVPFLVVACVIVIVLYLLFLRIRIVADLITKTRLRRLLVIFGLGVTAGFVSTAISAYLQYDEAAYRVGIATIDNIYAEDAKLMTTEFDVGDQ